MSFIPGYAIQNLMALTEVQANDDAEVCIKFDNTDKATPITKKDGTPLTLGDLRELAAAFGAWAI